MNKESKEIVQQLWNGYHLSDRELETARLILISLIKKFNNRKPNHKIDLQ